MFPPRRRKTDELLFHKDSLSGLRAKDGWSTKEEGRSLAFRDNKLLFSGCTSKAKILVVEVENFGFESENACRS